MRPFPTAKSSDQLLLPLNLDTVSEQETFFVNASNTQAWSWIQAWPRWPNHGLVFYGPDGGGKTYLASLWAKHTKAYTWPLQNDLSSLFEKKAPCLFVDNLLSHLEELEQQEALLQAYNSVCERGGQCLFVSDTPVQSHATLLPDLSSRLKALLTIEIQVPSDELLERIFVHTFKRQQVNVARDVIAFLLRRLKRSVSVAQHTALKLSEESLRHKRPITIDFVKSMGMVSSNQKVLTAQ